MLFILHNTVFCVQVARKKVFFQFGEEFETRPHTFGRDAAISRTLDKAEGGTVHVNYTLTKTSVQGAIL